MLPGPNYIYQCPTCDNLIQRRSLLSGNTFGAQIYSDLKRIAPMLPEFPILTKCSKCNAIFWLSRAKEIGAYQWGEEVKGDWKDVEEAKFLNVNEYLRALDTPVVNSSQDDELFIRQRIWWCFNDKVRNYQPLFFSEDDKNIWENNLNKLLNLLDDQDINQKVLIAEIYRNLGNFDKCLEIIDSLNDSNMDWLKERFIKECFEKNTQVFVLAGN